MSCCACLKIRVLSAVDNVPGSMLEGGKLFVDIDRKDALEFSRTLSQLSEINNIRDEAALPITLPYTDRNKAIAGFVRNHNLTGNKYDPLPVLVQEGATVHRLNYLQFTGANDETQKFEAQVQRGEGHWLNDANRLRLKDIVFDDFELNYDKLVNNWQENARYENGIDNSGYYWPLVNYGGWLNADAVMPEDLRPWFHLLALLEKGFCQIGWDFRSHILETGFGQRLICYLLGENLQEVPEILALRRFKATAEAFSVQFTQQDVGEKIIFGNEVYDYSQNYDTAAGAFSATGIFTFKVAFEYTHQGAQGPVVVSLVKEPANGQPQILAQQEAGTYFGAAFTSHTILLEATDVAVAAGDKICVRALPYVPDPILVTGYFEGFAQKAYLERGMVFNPATLIDPSLTLLDLYKAACHLFAGKTFTDWVRKRVWLYAPHDTDVFFDTDVKGFFQGDNIVDLTSVVVPRSQVVQLERTNKKRYLVLQFANSGDTHVKKLEEARTQPLYSKIVDRGSSYEEDFEYSKNPLFEATVNKELVKFPVVPPFIIANDEVDIPHCSDNDDGNISYKIGFRILYCQGFVRQRAANGNIRRWRIMTQGTNSTGMDLVPYAFQVPNSLTGAAPGTLPAQRVIYGDEEGSDLYSIAYRQELIDRLYTVRTSFKARLDANTYQSLSFRNLYKLHYNGRTFLARLMEINARRTCTDAPAEIILRPLVWGGDLCEEKEKVKYLPDVCPNYPEIDIAINVTADNITATAQDGAISDPILTDVWEYSTDGGSTWNAYTEGAAITGQPEVVFRRTVSFDADAGQCEKVATRTAIFETVCDNNPDIELEYNEGKNSIKATGTGTFNSTIATDTWAVEVDGGAAQAYTEGDEVNGFTTVKFTRTVGFTNSCQDVIAEKVYEVEGDQCNNTPALNLVEVAPCVYDLQISGTTTSTICMTVFEVSNDDGSAWLPWDGYPVKGEPGRRVRASIHFCDTCPPIYIEQECPF